MTKPSQLQIEAEQYAASRERPAGRPTEAQAGRRRDKIVVVRVPQHETKTDESHPGIEPPHRGALGIGRRSENWRPLYWKKVASEYKKEAPLRERHSEAALRVEIKVGHAPDDRTPYTYVDWGDPVDAKGAVDFARKLVQDGGARYAMAFAIASRPTSKRDAGDRGVRYDLARFERGEA